MGREIAWIRVDRLQGTVNSWLASRDWLLDRFCLEPEVDFKNRWCLASGFFMSVKNRLPVEP